MNNSNHMDSRFNHSGDFPNDLSKLDDLHDWEVADGEVDPRGYDVMDASGQKIGTIDSLLVSPSMEKAYFAIVDAGGWLSNKRFLLPLESMDFRDGRAHGPFVKDQFQIAPEWHEGEHNWNEHYSYWSGSHTDMAMNESTSASMNAVDNTRMDNATDHTLSDTTKEYRVPVTEESAEVTKTVREQGNFTVRKRAVVETEHISEPVTRTHVNVETRDLSPEESRNYTGNETVLREGEELRIPIEHEELEVRKVPRVTQEVVVRAEEQTEQVERDVDLRREVVDVDEEGEVDLDTPPHADQTHTTGKHRTNRR